MSLAGGAREKSAGRNPTTRIIIDAAWCKGCHICVSACPRQVLDIDQERFTAGYHPVVVRQIERCTACRTCELLCPDLAIEVSEE